MSYDYVQNSQGNGNQQSWNTLHQAVRNIKALTKVVAETNNEAHFNNQAAQEALQAAQEAIHVSGAHVASVGHSVSQAASHEASAARHADSVAMAHSTVAGIVSTARDEILNSLGDMLTIMQGYVKETSDNSEESYGHVVSASVHARASEDAKIASESSVTRCQELIAELEASEEFISEEQLNAAVALLELADTELSTRILALEEAELPEMVSIAEFTTLQGKVQVVEETQNLLVTEDEVNGVVSEAQKPLWSSVNAIDARLSEVAGKVPSIEGLATQESVGHLRDTLKDLHLDYVTKTNLSNEIDKLNHSISGFVNFDAESYHNKEVAKDILDEAVLQLETRMDDLFFNGGLPGEGGDGGAVAEQIAEAIAEAKIVSDEYTDAAASDIRAEMVTQKAEIILEVEDKVGVNTALLGELGDRVDRLEASDGGSAELDALIDDVAEHDTTIGEHAISITALETLTTSHTTNITENANNIRGQASSITTNTEEITALKPKVSALEVTVAEGLATAASERERMQTEINTLKSELALAISRIVELEGNHLPPVANPTKWYVLPLAGQSNMVGYGESRVTEFFGHMSSRIMQLPQPGRTATLNPDVTQYGDKFSEFRAETEQGLILAAPCLDFNQNMFTDDKAGTATGPIKGTVGMGLFLAEMLLPHIPNDYGIMIVPTGFGGQNFSYWHLNAGGYGRAFIDRVKQAMDINPDNKLLPFVWAQGESDAFEGLHEGYGAAWWRMYEEMKKAMQPYERRIAWGWKWFIYSGIRASFVISDADAEGIYDHLTHDVTDPVAQGFTSKLSATYSHFTYFNEREPDTFFPMRLDIDPRGRYTETNLEEGTGFTAGTWQHHFSSLGYKEVVAPAVANAILTYAKGYEPNFHRRKVRGGCGHVITDYVQYLGDAMPNLGDVAPGNTLGSFAITFNYTNKPSLYASTFNFFNNSPNLQARYTNGMLSFTAGGKWLFLSAFYHAGAWIGDRATTQEIGIVYKEATKEILIYLNDNLVDSWKGVSAITLPATLGLEPSGAECVSNLQIRALL